MKRILLLLVVLALCGCGGSKKQSSTLLIAVDAPFSRSPYIGQTIARGVELAVSEINVAGLAANNGTYTLKVKRYDNALSPRKALGNVRRAIADGAVAIVDDGTGVDASWKVARDAHVPICVTYDGGGGLVDLETRPNVFRIAPTNRGIAFRLAEYTIPKGLKLALMHDDTTYGQQGAEALDKAFAQNAGSVAVKLVLGMVMALVLTSGVRFRSFWTGVLLIPWVAPTVVSALNFLWIFDYSLGVLNYMLVKVFHILPQGIGWLSEPGTAMASVIGVNIWRGFPFFGISFLAGLRAIPAEMYEAAAVDGAGPLLRFRHVTLPGIRNIVIIVMLLSTIWTFNDFQIVYILTRGGPGGATQVLPVFTYEIAFGAQRLGEAIAVALYMLPALAAVIIVLARYMRKGRARQ